MADKIENQRNEWIESLELDNTQGITFENVMNFLKEIDVDANQKIDENEVNGSLDADFLNEEKNLAKFGELFDNLNNIDDETKKEFLKSFKSALNNMFQKIIEKKGIIGDEDKKILDFWEKMFKGKSPEDETKLAEFRKNQEELVKEEIKSEKLAAEIKLAGYVERFNGLPNEEKAKLKKLCNIEGRDLNNLESVELALDKAVTSLVDKASWKEDDIKNANSLNKILGEKGGEIREELEKAVQAKVDKVMNNIITYIGKHGTIPNNKEQGRIIQLGANVLAGEDLTIDGSRGSQQWNFSSQTMNEKKTNSYMWKSLIMNRDKIMANRKQKNLLFLPNLDDYLNQIEDDGQKEKTWIEFLNFFLSTVYVHGMDFENKITGTKFEGLLNLMIRAEVSNTVEEEIVYLEGLPTRNPVQERILGKLISGEVSDVSALYTEEVKKLEQLITTNEKMNLVEHYKVVCIQKLDILSKKIVHIKDENKKKNYAEQASEFLNKVDKETDKTILQKLTAEIDDFAIIVDNYEKESSETKIENNTIENISIEELDDISSIFNNLKLSDYNSLYKDEHTKQIVLKLLEYIGVSVKNINQDVDLENLINQFKEKKGIQEGNDKDVFVALLDSFYRVCLGEYTPYIYYEASMQRRALQKEKAFLCLEGLERIGTLKDGEYVWVYIKDLNDLGFSSLSDLKDYTNLDSIQALEYARKYGEQVKQSSQSDGIKTIGLDGYIYAPGAYSKMLTREYNYYELAKNSWGVLSLEDYNELFCNFNKFGQGDLGDCYLIASIRALARTAYFDTLIRTSFKCNCDGSYTVRFPLGEPSGKEIKVTTNDIKQAKVDGADGYKIIEVAYAKFLANHKEITSESQMEDIESSTTTKALYVLLGREGYDIKEYGCPKEKSIIIQNLKNFNPARGDTITFRRGSEDKENILPGKHAMIVSNVEKDSNGNITRVQIENPWNTLNRKEGKEYGSQKNMSLTEFLDFATTVRCGKITDKFMNLQSSNYLPAQQSWDKAIYNFNRIGDDPENIRESWNESWNRWYFDPSWEGVKNIPSAVGDYLNPVGDMFGHLGKGVGYTVKSGAQYAWGGVENAYNWTSEAVSNARESTTEYIDETTDAIRRRLSRLF